MKLQCNLSGIFTLILVEVIVAIYPDWKAMPQAVQRVALWGQGNLD
jgi:phage tail protein X